MSKINIIDLFAGCGGLGDGFEQTKHYETLAVVEWEQAPAKNYENRLKTKWGYKRSDKLVLRFDMQRTDELLNGWKNDPEYGSSIGLKKTIGNKKVDLVVGGPPCQAYSIAGRVRDENGMKNDYRNYLFESYVKVVDALAPRAFVFENVPGILSAMPDGTPIIDKIRSEFKTIGYDILPDLRKAVVDMSEYGVPQNRARVIILGLRQNYYGDSTFSILQEFYKNVLPAFKEKKKATVRDAIGDLPKLYPLAVPEVVDGKKRTHSLSNPPFPNHEPRNHSQRDIAIFRMLASDILKRTYKYKSASALKELYFEQTGHKSNVHKYHVLNWNEPSNLIPAHLYKDGLRHIHPDPDQARTITVREAARLQGFPDDYIFIGNQTENYKMIGNAVPPIFSNILAKAIYQLLFKE